VIIVDDIAAQMYRRDVDHAVAHYDVAVAALRTSLTDLGGEPAPSRLAMLVHTAAEVATAGARLHALREVGHLVAETG
jgi:hypothetical protein